MSVIKQHCFKVQAMNTSNTSSTSSTDIETYALNKLQMIFHEFRTQPSEFPNMYFTRSKCIVQALKHEYPYESDFKQAFWRILYNLKLKGTRSQDTLNDLFSGKWQSAHDFIKATDDELDETCAHYRHKVRYAMFERMENTKRLMDSLNEKNDDQSGLLCPKCKSSKTEYLLAQNSSGDEPSTARCVCQSCSYRWKFR